MKDNTAIILHKLPRGEPFRFQGDKQKDIYWFGKIDGMYGQVFASEKDMDNFVKPAFVGVTSVVIPVQ